jgi:hypothetical protein
MICIKTGRARGLRRKTVKQTMKMLILLALFSAIAAASYRRDAGEQPKPAA